MSINLNFLKDSSPFHYQAERMDDSNLPLLLPRSAWVSQIAYLRVLFIVKKKLDQIEKNSLVEQEYRE
jgi:hypothetical protein